MATHSPARDGRPGTFRSLRLALTSWRTASVTLLSFSSGLPLGLVWISLPDWMREAGIDIRIIGLTTLAHAPWTFKMLWSPLMDRYRVPWLGRRRGWILVTQVALLAFTLLLGGVSDHPDAAFVILALAFALAFSSASHDIVIDAYAVDVLRKDEQGIAVGARVALYRAAMFVAGALAITLTAWWSWAWVCVLLAALYLPLLVVTWLSPEPEVEVPAPATLRESVWLPFLGFLTRHRALEILAFVCLYKLSDNLAQSLMRPFFHDMGYSAVDRGIALGTVGFWSTILATFLGGALTNVLGLGRCLWIFGFLQIFSNLGYIVVANSEVNRPLMYVAMAFETATSGVGMGAFGVLLLRMTQKRFSATQYALFSSLFALPRLIAGPVTGFVVHAIGWTNFFWFTMVMGIPGMLMLARFVPITAREPEFAIEPPSQREPLTRVALGMRAALGGFVGLLLALLVIAVLESLESMKDAPESGFTFVENFAALLAPSGTAGWLTLLGSLVFALVCALMTAAVAAARHGAGAGLHDAEPE